MPLYQRRGNRVLQGLRVYTERQAKKILGRIRQALRIKRK